MPFDARQLKAINAQNGYFLVLAPPGCGKTEILAERIAQAIDRGVKPEQMLCLTFTNRASRSMRDRVVQRLGAEAAVEEIFIGNIHRYCSRYLFENNVIAENSYIIDEDDQNELLLSISQRLVTYTNGTINKNAVKYVVDLASYFSQRRMGHPEDVLTPGPGLLDRNTNKFMKHDFAHFYKIGESYGFVVEDVPNEYEALRAAITYNNYKASHCAVDFADLLILAYDHLVSHPDHRRYEWVQIDEVQDLNRLQLALADLLTAPSPTAMYLGDEQQAIFSFLGAKLSNLDLLRKRCAGNILTLEANYRSPSYLLEVCNTYAHNILGVPSDLLPKPVTSETPHRHDLILTSAPTIDDEANRVFNMVRHYLSLSDSERLAILVSRNSQADAISDTLTARGINNFKISGVDMFRNPSYKTLTALYAVLVNDFDMGAWTRLLFGLKCTSAQVRARELVHKMRRMMLTPSDLLRPVPYLKDFYDVCTGGEAVVFDTETTGLNVLEDDIVQIAAFKIRGGKKVAGSDFNIILHTDRPIPDMLGDKPNPLVEEYARRPHMPRAEGLRSFLNYAGTLPLIGHNVTYDYLMLRNNCSRELNEDVTFTVFDTLHVAKLVAPELKKYTLEALISEFNLQGTNAHLADADIEATLSLIQHCLGQAAPVFKIQEAFLENPELKKPATRLAAISPLISNIKSYLHLPVSVTQRTIADELASTYRLLCDQNLIEDIGPKFDVFLRYVECEWVDRTADVSLFDQVSTHINDLTSTINEGDLVNSDPANVLISDRVFIMTIHKAKGLQFDNVVVLGVRDGVFPFYGTTKIINSFDSTPEMKQAALADRNEDARKLYVALSRARKRLCISYTENGDYGHRAGISPFLLPITHLFTYGPHRAQ